MGAEVMFDHHNDWLSVFIGAEYLAGSLIVNFSLLLGAEAVFRGAGIASREGTNIAVSLVAWARLGFDA